MALVVSCLGVAVDGACRGVEPLGLTECMIFVAHIGVLTLGVVGSIDCTAKFNRSSIARNCRWRSCFIVRIRSSDHNLKVIPPLSFVGSLGS